MAKPKALIVKALRDLASGKAEDRVARKYGVHPLTVRRWRRRYPKNERGEFEVGEKGRPAHNRLPAASERRIYLTKEREPGITLDRARASLRAEGVNVCCATIRRVWREYGFSENPMNQPPNEAAIPAGCRDLLRRARRELERTGDPAGAARLLNRMKVCPDLGMLERIPDRHLNVRHRLQKLDAMRRVETMSVFYRRARGVRRCLERNRYYYSMLQAGFVEASALSWLEHPERGLKLIEHLIRVTPGPLNRFLRFRFTYYRGRYLADMLRTDEALACARRCEELIKSLNHYDLYIKLSQLYSSLGNYFKARSILEKAWNRFHPRITEEDRLCHAVYAAINGDYRSALATMSRLTGVEEKYRSLQSTIQAYCAIGSGDLERALELSRQAVTTARREGFLNVLQGSIVVQACVYSALGFKAEAIKVIKKIMPLLAQRKVMRDYYVHAVLAGKICVADKYESFPPINLLLGILKAGRTGRASDYRALYRFAASRGLLGILHRYCLLAPDIVIRMQRKAKPTRLPRAILGLPLFNQNLPNLRLDFLGSFKVYREDRPIKARLRPKDAAFLIHLLNARDSRLDVKACLENFWPRAGDPMNNLYHLLRRLRQQLMIPPQYLFVQRDAVHYTGTSISDYRLIKESLSLAQNLERADEWPFANREYQNAFRLIRGEPFRRLYDPWSDRMRGQILSQFEAAAGHYAERCRTNGAPKDGDLVMERIKAILP